MRGRLIIGLALLLAGPAMAQPRPANQQVGSWIVTCPADPESSCQMRHESWLLPPGGNGPNASLEVMQRGGQFVPVVTLRGLTTQTALGGMLALNATVTLRLDAGPPIPLSCGLNGTVIVCAADGTAVAATLPTAHTAQVRIALSVPGIATLPEQSRSLDLQRTAEAMALFRTTAPANQTVPALPGLDWHDFLDRLLREAGFERGVASMMPSVAR
jgi:hypothetical protein